ncbi:hypothetical protein C8Q70DRAFT_681022 [Cubamyces menziesii]|nr:hypothetical protein C8Q70DRAFT_681022 [Cubamyces menziesii]
MINLLCLSRLEPLFWVEAQTIPSCRTLHTPFERSARAVSRDPPATPSRHPRFTGSGTRALPAASDASTPKIFAIETLSRHCASYIPRSNSRSPPFSTVRLSRPLRYRPICLLRLLCKHVSSDAEARNIVLGPAACRTLNRLLCPGCESTCLSPWWKADMPGSKGEDLHVTRWPPGPAATSGPPSRLFANVGRTPPLILLLRSPLGLRPGDSRAQPAPSACSSARSADGSLQCPNGQFPPFLL